MKTKEINGKRRRKRKKRKGKMGLKVRKPWL
jgi:hypothetical protein